ncbi:MAG: ATP synthase F0 subunit B [Acidobacteriaceae bacterium]|nr:ATP synthase F0 subunit B [Acidobacteriaceae bacterium]
MEATLKALADLLLEAVPTILFFLFLTWYLKRVFFRPVAAILEQRRNETEGVRELARRAFEAADKKQSEFEHALQLARGEIYQEHEKLRRQWSDEQAQAIAQAREEVDRQIAEAKRQITAEAERAQQELDSKVEGLSEGIVNSLLSRRAA